MRNITILSLSCTFLISCEKAPEIQKITGFAQGTTYSVKYWHENSDPVDSAPLKQAIDKELARIDKLMSNYREDSNIEVFNHNKVANIPILLDKEILKLIAISTEVHQKSLGCYDPTIGPLFKIWGFKKDNLHIPSDVEIKTTLQSIGFAEKIIINGDTVVKKHPEATIGLSAIGQGYAVSKISDLLKNKGITNFITEIGGEMLVLGTKPEEQQWHVGVERPIPNSKKINEIVSITGNQATAIMTSGTYRHYFDNNGKRYSHILDPRSGKPVEHDSVAVTVILPDATYADAWSTALLCLGSKEGLVVANNNAIPTIFYDIKEDKQLSRKESTTVASQKKNWEIKSTK